MINDEKHYDELDILKGLGIMLIVLGHLEPGTYLMRFVYSFHLFLFFICSGYLGQRYEDREFVTIVFNNIKRLVIPYLLWSVLSQIVDIVLGCIGLLQAVKNTLFLDANVGWNAALWFLVSLFWTDLICALVVKCKRWLQIGFIVLFIGVWIVFSYNKIVLPFGLYTVPIASTFWLTGYLSKKYSILEKVKKMNVSSKIAWGGYC